MQAGAACVPIDVVFHREVMGERGLFFGKEPGRLAALLRELESAPQRIEALGSLAYERASTLYRWDAVAAAYAELFEKIHALRRRGQDWRGLAAEEVYRPLEFTSRREKVATSGRGG
jgi:glycosyltransferase involved in cell wall biosynthesis